MEHASQEITIHFLGVFIAAISCFFIGGLWYSPILFGRQWMKLNHFTEEDLKSKPSIFLWSFLLLLIASITLAAFLGRSGFIFSLQAGFMVGLFWVGFAMGVTYLFERKSFKLWAINAGYHIVAFTTMGAIIGAFQG